MHDALFAERLTIGREVEFAGVGLHTGQMGEVKLLPVSEQTGIVLRRTDLPNAVEIPALVEFVVGTQRCVTLGRDGVRVAMVEHLLAALWAFGISDVMVEVYGAEIPIGGGDALCWVELLQRAGRVKIGGKRKVLRLEETVTVSHEQAEVRAEPCERLEVCYLLRFNHPLVREQTACFSEGREEKEVEEGFVQEIAAARTFGFVEEVQALRAKGLALGGSLENALVVYPDGFSSPLRFPNELARHKILDLLGDLSLLGSRLQAKLTAVRAGHELHVELVRRIRRDELDAEHP